MSDFFARLAARTLGVAPTVRPHLAPLFAQGPAMPSQDRHGPADGSGDQNALTPFDGAAGAHHGGLSSVLSRAEADLSPPAPMDALYAAATAPPHDVAATGPRPLQRGDVAAPPPTATSPTPPTDRLSAWPPGGDVGIGPARHRRGMDAESLAPAGQRQQTAEEVEPAGEAVLSPLTRRRAVHIPAEASLGRPASTATSRRPQLIPSLVASASTPPDQRDDAQTLVPDAPIIRVTIGRIEVRAIMPPAPAPPHQPPPRPAPNLSLEEYLHQRREGRR